MLDVKQTLNDASERMEMAAMYLSDELQRIRAGRANVAILDGVRVDSYGSKVPLNQVASVMVHVPLLLSLGIRKLLRTLRKLSWILMWVSRQRTTVR